MVKIIVCRIGEEPKVEEVENPYHFFQTSLNVQSYVEAKLFWIGKERVVFYWDEDARRKNSPHNRNVPCTVSLPDAQFTIDIREGPPEMYAKSGEPGFFPILGNFLVTKADGEGEHISLKDEEVRTLLSLLALPAV